MDELSGCDNAAVTIDEVEKCTDCDSADPNPQAPAPLPDDDEIESDKVKYYVVHRLGLPFTTKKEAAKFIEEEIEKGMDKSMAENLVVIRGRPYGLSFETKVTVK